MHIVNSIFNLHKFNIKILIFSIYKPIKLVFPIIVLLLAHRSGCLFLSGRWGRCRPCLMWHSSPSPAKGSAHCVYGSVRRSLRKCEFSLIKTKRSLAKLIARMENVIGSENCTMIVSRNVRCSSRERHWPIKYIGRMGTDWKKDYTDWNGLHETQISEANLCET